MEYIENMAAALLEKRLARLRVKNKIAYTAIVSIVLSGFIVLTIFLFGHGNYFKGLVFALFDFLPFFCLSKACKKTAQGENLLLLCLTP